VADANEFLVFVVNAALEDPPPISINDAYTPFKGQLRLTKAGKAYKDSLADAVARASLDWKRAHESIYQHGGWATVLITLYFTNLLNLSWKPGGMTKQGNPQSPYKKKDAPNYLKLTVDAVERGSGIDDCNYTDTRIRKRQDAECPRVEVTMATYVANSEAYIELMDS
jgi:hypothetical protein